MTHYLLRVAISISALAVAPSAVAQSLPVDLPELSGSVNIGAIGLHSSEYLGSGEEDTRILPYLSLNDVNGFDLFGTNLSYRLIETGTGEGLDKWSLRAGPRIAYQSGRQSEDSPTLTGLDDVDGSVLLGGYVRGTLGPLGYRLDAGQDIIGGHEGFVVDASIGTFYRQGRYAVQPSFTVSWADASHNDAFFSLTPGQSAASDLAQYDAGSGVYAYSAGLVSWVEMGDYNLSFIGSYRWFTDLATDSPILQAPDGSDEGLFAGIGLSRQFNF